MNIIIESTLMNTAKRFGKQSIVDHTLRIKYASSESNHALTPIAVSKTEIKVKGEILPFKVSRKPITIVKDITGATFVAHNVGRKVQWYMFNNPSYFLFDYEASAKGSDDGYDFLTGMLNKQVTVGELLSTFPGFFSGLDNLDHYSHVTIGDMLVMCDHALSPETAVTAYVNASSNFSRALAVLIDDGQMVWLCYRANIHNEFRAIQLIHLLTEVTVKELPQGDSCESEENTITPTASAWMDVEDVDVVANENRETFTDEHLTEILETLETGNETQRKYANMNLNTVMANPGISGLISPSLWAEAVKVYRRMGESRTLPKIASVAESTLERDFENDLYNLLGRYAIKGLNVPVVLGRIMDAEDKDER